MNNAVASVNHRSSLSCRLCWKVTIAVFFAILCIEAAILFFSVDNFKRDRLLEIEREATVVVRNIIRSTEIDGKLSANFSAISQKLSQDSVLVGASIHDPQGVRLFDFGDGKDFKSDIIAILSSSRRFSGKGQRMDFVLSPERLRAPYFVVARLNSSEIAGDVKAFIWRITGLVLLISVFVTLVTILVLEKLVLSPIRNLATSMMLAGSDPDNPDRHLMETVRKDEWGDIINAFNRMLSESSIHLQKIQKQETELRKRADDLDITVRERTMELRETQLKIIQRLGRAGEYRDNETGTHVIRMSRSSQVLALAAGLSEKHAEQILFASPMHDVGKIGIKDDILLKPGPLTEAEFDVMRTHPQIGADIIGEHQSPILRLAREIALSHHEKWDGSGYPNGLSGEDIPIEARIVAICDVFDALTSKRPYKDAWPFEEAVEFMQEQSGSHFDPALVGFFINSLTQVKAIMEEFKDDD